jgi:hypothetical protein
LKLAAYVIDKPVAKIINTSLLKGIFPKAWKLARITPIHKAGPATNVENFRPISILPILSKIIERHVHQALYKYLTRYELLSQDQSGFRSLHSCATSLTHLVNKWYAALDTGNIIGCLSVDLRRAFDVLSHDILLQKLEIYRFNDLSLRWFSSYLSDRQQSVKISDVMSSFSCIKHGVPQGSILGPLMFILYVNDLPLAVPDLGVNMYADDTEFESIQKTIEECNAVLQENISNVNNWCNNNKLIINEQKTKAMIVCSEQKHNRLDASSFQLTMNGKNLENVSHMKILGVTIDQCLKWDVHVTNVCTKLSQMSGLLWNIKDDLTFDTRQIFYYSHVLPVIDYCSIVWGQCNITLLGRIYMLQKRIARNVLKNYVVSEIELFKKLNWLNIYKRITYQTVIMVYKSVNGMTPSYLSNVFHFSGENYEYILRNSGINLRLPKPRTNMMKRSFTYCGAQLWNSIPVEVRQATTVNEFKNKCKSYLLNMD